MRTVPGESPEDERYVGRQSHERVLIDPVAHFWCDVQKRRCDLVALRSELPISGLTMRSSDSTTYMRRRTRSNTRRKAALPSSSRGIVVAVSNMIASGGMLKT